MRRRLRRNKEEELKEGKSIIVQKNFFPFFLKNET